MTFYFTLLAPGGSSFPDIVWKQNILYTIWLWHLRWIWSWQSNIYHCEKWHIPDSIWYTWEKDQMILFGILPHMGYFFWWDYPKCCRQVNSLNSLRGTLHSTTGWQWGSCSWQGCWGDKVEIWGSQDFVLRERITRCSMESSGRAGVKRMDQILAYIFQSCG